LKVSRQSQFFCWRQVSKRVRRLEVKMVRTGLFMSRGKGLIWDFIAYDQNFYISVGRAALE
jgi:hypothetical protein